MRVFYSCVGLTCAYNTRMHAAFRVCGMHTCILFTFGGPRAYAHSYLAPRALPHPTSRIRNRSPASAASLAGTRAAESTEEARGQRQVSGLVNKCDTGGEGHVIRGR